MAEQGCKLDVLDCVLLAAGASRRFGACKLLEPWQGRPVIAWALSAARRIASGQLVVVTGAFDAELQAWANTEGSGAAEAAATAELWRCCTDWALGMGHSLAFGVEQLTSTNPVLILLGDQPLINHEELTGLYNTWSQTPDQIACALHEGVMSVPAIFPARYKAQLRTCEGDQGARSILRAERDSIVAVPMPSAAFDIDVPEDILQLSKKIL